MHRGRRRRRVADYCGVDPRFDTLADFDDLLAQAHVRGLKVLLDFVPNHTSDQHPWFVQSRSSRDNPRRDWYIWRDPAPGGCAPNNWISDFGGSAWEWDEATGQYYYHASLKEQADLNWRNPAVQATMYAVMRFWFDRGVDGCRRSVATATRRRCWRSPQCWKPRPSGPTGILRYRRGRAGLPSRPRRGFRTAGASALSRLRLGPSQSRPLTDTSPGSARSPGLKGVIRAARCAAEPSTHMLGFEPKASPFCAVGT